MSHKFEVGGLGRGEGKNGSIRGGRFFEEPEERFDPSEGLTSVTNLGFCLVLPGFTRVDAKAHLFVCSSNNGTITRD